MRNGLITVTKLSYGYDDVDCVVVLYVVHTEWGPCTPLRHLSF
jgi:hypothetical protein